MQFLYQILSSMVNTYLVKPDPIFASRESLWKEMIGKSRFSGRKPNVGFDEGELETGSRQDGLRRHLRKEWR
ncbi:MAG: hypothetical protein B6I32_02835 [Desulfobacterium sp. 4572_20]|nr:MAG: hypothetical protein B6I32_02835 [Desulfobacterium sp. 4572_20]RLB21349.1 MAG: hypothetical protein DRG73_08700 [Deltaproteobacteria bacterium]RLJ04530.1 MAG: hypothetical protein DRP14_03195 [Candidatus Aenigmarchaeota archaeon]